MSGTRSIGVADRRQSRRWLSLTAPANLFLVVFFGLPLAIVIVDSFRTAAGFGVDAYASFLTDPVGTKILIRTLLTAAGITVACLALGYPYAYLLSVVSQRTRRVMLAMVLIPFWSSVMVRTFAWLVMLGQGGPVHNAFEALGVTPPQMAKNLTGAVIGMVHIMLPYMVLPLYSTMRDIDRRLVTVGQSLGASPRSAFFRIFAPLSLPGVFAGATLVMILSLGFFVTPAVLGSPQQALLSQLIVSRTLQVLDLQLAGAMAVVLLVVTLVILAAFSKLSRPILTTGGEV